MSLRWHWLPAVAACLLTPAAWAQEKPFERNFSLGSVQRYRVRLIVRSELEGEQPVTREGAAYAQKFTRASEGALAWVAARRVIALGGDGTAEIEETLDDFNGPNASGAAADEGSQTLLKAILESLRRWSEPRSLVVRYRETRAGRLLELESLAVPNLAEAKPPLLTLWLLRALRPTSALPARPIGFGDRWQEPRAAKLDGWTAVQASESGEWLEASESDEPAARVLVVQQLLGTVTAGPEKPAEGAAQGRFHGESLATISLRDGRLLSATRSATLEISWTLNPTPGLLEPPQFHARLSAQIAIEECHGPRPSNSLDQPVLRRRQ